jgi:hypothetical protein
MAAPGDGQGAPAKAADKGVKRDSRSDKTGLKWQPQ